MGRQGGKVVMLQVETDGLGQVEVWTRGRGKVGGWMRLSKVVFYVYVGGWVEHVVIVGFPLPNSIIVLFLLL